MKDNPQLALARDFLEHTGTNIFLTGKAGTGKTTFLHSLRVQSPKRMIVVAPTGVAAINASGVTMHSFFQLSFGVHIPGAPSNEGYDKRLNRAKINIIRSLDLLVIDEVSMVRADTLDAVDAVLRKYRDRHKPFGGVQLLMIGDLQQLAPVVRDDEWQHLREYYDSPFFFDSIALKSAQYISVELTEIYRQSDPHFIDILAKVRANRLDSDTLSQLNERYIADFDPPQSEGYITLTSHNNTAREINDRKLDQLDGRAYQYSATVSGTFPESIYPIDSELILKKGAQVMFAKNDTSPEKRYVNGTIGTVTDISSTMIEVTTATTTEPIVVDPAIWENVKYTVDAQTKEISQTIEGTFLQYPLKTAWAITIHKSQGLTFERAIIDAAGSFSHGQVYVALSRCKSLEGMVLRTPISQRSIINDSTVALFNDNLCRNQPTEQTLDILKREYHTKLLVELFDFSGLGLSLKFLQRYITENLVTVYPKLIELWDDSIDLVERELVLIGAKFASQINQLVTKDYATDAHLRDRVTKASAYFLGALHRTAEPLLKASRVDVDNKNVKKVLGEALERAVRECAIKIATLEAASREFTVHGYLDARGKASIDEAAAKGDRTIGPKTEKITKVEGSTDIENEELFEILRAWRRAEAEERGVPSYTVLSQKGLIGIVNTMPTTAKETLQIKGIGAKFIEKYGVVMASILDDYRAGREGAHITGDE